MILYHRTTQDAAQAILAEGFRDGTGTYLTDSLHTGVWLSDQPLDANEGAVGDTLLEMRMPAHVVEAYEWVQEGWPYREFLIPAALVNAYGPPRIVPDDDVNGSGCVEA